MFVCVCVCVRVCLRGVVKNERLRFKLRAKVLQNVGFCAVNILKYIPQYLPNFKVYAPRVFSMFKTYSNSILQLKEVHVSKRKVPVSASFSPCQISKMKN